MFSLWFLTATWADGAAVEPPAQPYLVQVVSYQDGQPVPLPAYGGG